MLVVCVEYPAKLFGTQGDWVDTCPYVSEDRMTKCWSVWLIVSFHVVVRDVLCIHLGPELCYFDYAYPSGRLALGPRLISVDSTS